MNKSPWSDIKRNALGSQKLMIWINLHPRFTFRGLILGACFRQTYRFHTTQTEASSTSSQLSSSGASSLHSSGTSSLLQRYVFFCFVLIHEPVLLFEGYKNYSLEEIFSSLFSSFSVRVDVHVLVTISIYIAPRNGERCYVNIGEFGLWPSWLRLRSSFSSSITCPPFTPVDQQRVSDSQVFFF